MCLRRLQRTLEGGQEGEERFHFDAGEGSRLTQWGDSVYIKFDENGKVIGTGNPIWGQNGRVRFVGLPWIYPAYPREIKTHIRSRMVASEVKVGVTLKVEFRSSDFDYQELLDKLQNGELQGSHLDDWLKNLFRAAVGRHKPIEVAFECYLNHGRSALLIEELGQALQTLAFSGRPISNIAQINATLDFNITAEASVTYV